MSDMPEPSIIYLDSEESNEASKVGSQQQQSTDVKVVPARTESSCVICLEKIATDLTLLSCCSHYFCYVCIETWIFNNPCCPMCKVPLEYIKHNLKSVPTQLPANFYDYDGKVENVPDKIAKYELNHIQSLPDNHDFRFEEHYVTENLTRLYANLDRINHFIETQSFAKHDGLKSKNEITDTIARYSKLKVILKRKDNPPSRFVIYNNPEFRRIIYRFNLGPRNRIAPRFPFDCSSSNIEQNVKLVRFKLIPYLSMELAGILQKTVIDFDRYLNVVMNWLTEKNKNQKTMFTKQLTIMGIANPHHFLSNLTHYLGSGQRLNVYHENTEWRPRGEIGFSHLFNDNSDVQVISEIAPPPRNQFPHDEVLRSFMDQLINREQPPVLPLNNDTVINISDDEASSRDGDAEENVQLYTNSVCRFNRPYGPPTPYRNNRSSIRSGSIITPNLAAFQRRRLLREMPRNLLTRKLLRQDPKPAVLPFSEIDCERHPIFPSTRSSLRLPTPPLIDVDEGDEQPGPSTSSSSTSDNSRHPRIRYPALESDADVQIIRPKRSRN